MSDETTMNMTLSETNPTIPPAPASRLNMSNKYTAEVGLVNSIRALEQNRKNKAERLRREKPALTSVCFVQKGSGNDYFVDVNMLAIDKLSS